MDETGLNFSWLVVLYEDVDGGAPSREIAAEYAEALGDPDYPVLSDIEEQILEITPYDGNGMPGLCALSPEMELIDCRTGHGKFSKSLEKIAEHAGL